MADSQPFVDHYRILQLDPGCDAKDLEHSYRHLAKMYHPDHAETADVTKLNEVIDAYRALKNPDDRAAYDAVYSEVTGYIFPANHESDLYRKSAVTDADIHAKILLFLYRRRREHAQDPGVGRYFVQELIGCSDEHFEFHTWYLKAKGFVETTEQGSLVITVEGVDHVIATSRTNIREKLLIAQSHDNPDQTQP
ncbi:DnaJ domain-containing protein [Novosphingobium sp. G106]|uniref:J domain-containing protein n=1 Tax=Novosphingobium sp. G106 TaxID=2849500 RepID=UPI001C2D075B|nr:J domain-containing protein [Novosphingobium sp. G106]MBV1688355.1 DnaJ domain-containing protein [Novosphingobium sp. G106]